MTVETTTNKVIWQGNGATTVFDYNFEIDEQSYIVLTYTDASGNQTELSNTAYSVTGLGNGAGGTITYSPAGGPIAVNTSLTLQRVVPYTQPTSLSNQGGLWPAVVMEADDYQEYQIQQLEEQVGRALLFNPADPGPFAPLVPAAQRAGLALLFDVNGNPYAGGFAAATVPVSAAMASVVGAASVGAAFDLIAAGGGTIGGNVTLSGTLTATDFIGASEILSELLTAEALNLTAVASNDVLVINGGSAVAGVAPGTSGNVLTSNGTLWTSTAPAGAPSLPSGDVLIGNGTNAATGVAPGTNGNVLTAVAGAWASAAPGVTSNGYGSISSGGSETLTASNTLINCAGTGSYNRELPAPGSGNQGYHVTYVCATSANVNITAPTACILVPGYSASNAVPLAAGLTGTMDLWSNGALWIVTASLYGVSGGGNGTGGSGGGPG